jgi:GAF domain-containing protein
MAVSEALLTETFVQLADSLVDEFDIVELLTVLADRCVDVLEADAAGILLADGRGALHVVAASSEQVRLLELFQLQSAEGPCLDCFTSGSAVVNPDIEADARWPRFSVEAQAAGYRAVHAFPLRLRDTVIGALNIFTRSAAEVTERDHLVSQALADVATIAILQHRAVAEAEQVVAQLQQALTSRISIEQAKGVLAERAGLDMDKSFARLRAFARSTNRKLSEVAAALVDGTMAEADVNALVEVVSPPIS